MTRRGAILAYAGCARAWRPWATWCRTSVSTPHGRSACAGATRRRGNETTIGGDRRVPAGSARTHRGSMHGHPVVRRSVPT